MLVTLQKNRLFAVLASSIVLLLVVAFPALAQQDFGFNQVANIGGGAIGTADLRDIIVNIVNIALGFLGIVAILIIIYAGWLWMSSDGNQEQIDRAKKTLVNATIGLLIILSSVAIINFFFNETLRRVIGGPPPVQGPIGSGGLGAGIVESVYPAPFATGIPRNTNIFVTFKEPIDTTTIASGGPGSIIVSSAVKIINNNTGVEDSATVFFNSAGTVFTFDPLVLLGSDIVSSNYTVQLLSGIKKLNGDPAFSSTFGSVGFLWNFEVSSLVDVTPPKITSYLPAPNTVNPRNVIISMRFDEAINPVSIDSLYMKITEFPSIPITGTLFQAGDYITIEFLPDTLCDNSLLNTCGEPVYCLPENNEITTDLIADDINSIVLDGIQDAAGNSFDGDSDGIATGIGASSFNLGLSSAAPSQGTGDNAFWNFDTDDTIDLIPPQIASRVPDSRGFHPIVTEQLMVQMDKYMRITSLKPDGSYGDGKEYVTLIDPFAEVGYWITGINGSNGCSIQCLNEGSSSVLASVCGDGIVDFGEDCDDQNTTVGDGCSADCLHEGTATCGDGILDYREDCEDSGTANGDGCSASCKNEGALTQCASVADLNCCGNGTVEVGEDCDDLDDTGCDAIQCLYVGNNGTADPKRVCGDGIIQRDLGEECDFGDTINGDGCDTLCRKEGAMCNNGVLNIGEDCDLSIPGTTFCSNSCINMGNILTCQNSTKNNGEDCDYGVPPTESFVFINQTGLRELEDYGVRVGSGIQDSSQNCFFPSGSSQPVGNECLIAPSTSYLSGWGPSTSQVWNPSNPGSFPNCLLP